MNNTKKAFLISATLHCALVFGWFCNGAGPTLTKKHIVTVFLEPDEIDNQAVLKPTKGDFASRNKGSSDRIEPAKVSDSLITEDDIPNITRRFIDASAINDKNGTVTVSFLLTANGVKDINITEPHNTALEKLTIEAIAKAASSYPRPLTSKEIFLTFQF